MTTPPSEPGSLERSRRTDEPPSLDGRARDERVPLGRIVLWSLIGLIVIAGVVLYLRYAGVVTPVLDQPR